MLRHKPLITCLLVVLVLPGCAGMAPADPEATDYVMPKPGSTIEVMQTLNAPAGTRISLQHGRVLAWRDVVSWQPYCQFHVLRPSKQINEPLVIEPDTFIVERSYRRKDMVASDLPKYAFFSEGSNGPSQRMMSTYLELSSKLQPDVYRLVCQRWDDPYFYNHLSIRDIRESLGDLVRLTTN